MTDNNIKKMIDDAVEEFRKKLEKEFKEPELTGTQFECIDNNGELFIADAAEFNHGTLILVENWEVFRILETIEQKPWITYLGNGHTHTSSSLKLCVMSALRRRLSTWEHDVDDTRDYLLFPGSSVGRYRVYTRLLSS